MLAPPLIPANGVAFDAIASLIAPRPVGQPTRIGLIGVGLKMHFVWSDAVASYQRAIVRARASWKGVAVELVAPAEPFESAESVLLAAEQLRAQGICGLILFHGAYTAGEIGAALGRWLNDNRVPLLSWATPEPIGGRLTANSLCCQNFLLHILHRLKVPYEWIFKATDDPTVHEPLGRFARCVQARAAMNGGKLLLLGSGRVPGFYDAEADELGVVQRFGLRFDRVDLVQAFAAAERFSKAQLRAVMQAVITAPGCRMNNVPEEQFFQTLRLALGTLTISAGHNYLGAAIRCWPDLWDHWGCAADGALSLINDHGLPAADEADMPGLISMMAMHLVTTGTALPTLMDISRLTPGSNRLGFWHCGGSATRLVRAGTQFEARRHSIMENADENTAVGMLIESLLALGPVTVARYLAPDAASAFLFEGTVVDSPMAFRGAYAEFEPQSPGRADQIMGTILDKGLDHHWVLGRGHFAEDLRRLNHWLNVREERITNPGGGTGISTPRQA